MTSQQIPGLLDLSYEDLTEDLGDGEAEIRFTERAFAGTLNRLRYLREVVERALTD